MGLRQKTRRGPGIFVAALVALGVCVPVAMAGNGSEDAFYEGNADDGSPVFFETGEQLTGDDNDGNTDVYKRESGQITLISGGSDDTDAFFVGAAIDGSPVFFETSEQLTDDDDDTAIDLYKRQSGQITLVSEGTEDRNAFFEGVADDGSPVYFETDEKLTSNDVEGDCPSTPGDCLFDVYKRESGVTSLVSTGTDQSGAGFNGAADDGSPAYFQTNEQVTGNDNDLGQDIYRRQSGQNTLVSGSGTDDFASFQDVSADGSRVFFETFEQLDEDDDDNVIDIYRSESGQITLVSGASDDDFFADFRGMAEDGSPVFFETEEPLEGDDQDEDCPNTPGDCRIDVYRFQSGQVALVSSGNTDDEDVNYNGNAEDGYPVAFTSTEPVVDGDNDSVRDVFKANSSLEVSQVSSGPFPVPAFFSAVAGDGSSIFFHTAERLTAADDDFGIDLYGRESGFLTLLSGSGEDNAVEGEGFAFDGDPLYFSTDEQLVDDDNDSDFDVYKNAGGVISLVSG